MKLSPLAGLTLVTTLLACAAGAASEQATGTLLCDIDTDGVVTGPRADLCQHLVDRYATLIDTTAIAGRAEAANIPLVQMSRAPGGRWLIRYSTSLLFPRGLTAPTSQAENGTFSHEIGHDWLIPLMAGGRGTSTPRMYGTEAPDWLDEAWAVWAESATQRAGRWAMMPRGLRPSLRTLVLMPHPIALVEPGANEPIAELDPVVATQTSTTSPCPKCDWIPDSLRNHFRIDSIRLRASGATDTVVTWTVTRPLRIAAEAPDEHRFFYPLSYSLLRYIRETGGTAAVRELIARYRRDPTPRTAALERLPGLPPSFTALEAGWHTFLDSRLTEPQ